MAQHSEQRVLPYTPEQMFGLVADVEAYPQFLPWCVGARIRRRTEAEITADLMIGFKIYRERFTSRVLLAPPGRITAIYADGPFRHLRSEWTFTPAEGGCLVAFFVDFEFKSQILQTVISFVFTEAVHRMVAAFEARARALYGAGVALEQGVAAQA